MDDQTKKAHLYYNIMNVFLLVSLLCAIPFIKYVIDEPWKNANAVEIMKERCPHNYYVYMQEKNANYSNWNTVVMEDLMTPWLKVSAYAGLPFFLLMFGTIASAYGIIAFIKSLPLAIIFIIKAIVVYLIFNTIILGMYNLFANIYSKIKGK